MPKIIENVDQNIREIAKDLFHTQGFEQTSMRQIAQHTNIAVGTLYHYYKDKESLYRHILIDTWRQIKTKLESLTNQTQSPHITFQQMLQTFITEINAQHTLNQLWQGVAKMHAEKILENQEENEFEDIPKQFSQLFSKVLIQTLDYEPTGVEKITLENLGDFAFIMAINSCNLSSQEIEPQSHLITEVLFSYASQSNNTQTQPIKNPKENTIKWS